MEDGLSSRMSGSDAVKPKEDDPYMKRFQLLRYRDVTRLCDVMETKVPIHGTGNFPTLEIRPICLVQLVRERLLSAGIKVRDIRLNGSAATHVLSDDVTHTYKDLDLIFAIDFPSMTQDADVCDDTKNRNKSEDSDNHPTESLTNERIEMLRTKGRPSSFQVDVKRNTSTPPPDKLDASYDFFAVDDSGYTSSDSSLVSAPVSPSLTYNPLALALSRREHLRSRTRSLESLSSTSSILPSSSSTPVHKSSKGANCRDFLLHHRSWQEIKDITMETLLEFLPPRVNRSKMNSSVLGSAYVQKMVKVTNDSDEWSLISLNNNSGRNLELKFVQSMKRQYEFSVDSFQIILDTYIGFRSAAQTDNSLQLSESFHPTVIAESVYGDFTSALRHLHKRRICTHRPEEIRGGGLLRYCNLLVRDFKPGECNASDDGDSSSNELDEVAKLEQHMCSRFFIDFNDIDMQQKKLISYLENRFAGEEDVKFQYLLMLRQVVGKRTVCLMMQEKMMILDLITMLMRQTLANNVAKTDAEAAVMHQRIQMDYCEAKHRYYHDGSIAHHNAKFCSNLVHPLPDAPSTPEHFHHNQSLLIRTSAPNTMPPQTYPQHGVGGQYHRPIQCNTLVHSRAPGPVSVSYPIETMSSCYCCSRCSCCGQQKRQMYPATHFQTACNQYPTNTVQPIVYDSGNMTCYYSPLGYTQKPQ